MAVPSQVTILDGSIGHLLKLRKVQTSAADTEWATSFLVPALANIDAPKAVQQACTCEYCTSHQVHRCWLHAMQCIFHHCARDLIGTNT